MCSSQCMLLKLQLGLVFFLVTFTHKYQQGRDRTLFFFFLFSCKSASVSLSITHQYLPRLRKHRLSDHCWFLFLFSPPSSCIQSNRDFFYYLSCKEEESTSTWTDLGVNKKGFLNLWDDVQHVSYINIYLKYKSILLLLNFGFFYIEDTMLRMRGGTVVFTHQRDAGQRGTCSSPRAVWEEWAILCLHRCITHHPTLFIILFWGEGSFI